MTTFCSSRLRAAIARCAIVVCALAVGVAVGAPAPIVPGTYLTAGGGGTLEIAAANGGGFGFSIEVVGANLHECSLDGTIHGLVAQVDSADDPKKCTVRFQPGASGIAVAIDDATDEACRTFCGARAWFPGTYLLAPAACTEAARKKTTAEFAALYKSKNYAGALARLQPTLQACDRFLRSDDDGHLRNDLAITLFHLNLKADCRAMLAPVISAWPHDEAALRDGLAPGDFDDILPIARAAWHNDKLCAR